MVDETEGLEPSREPDEAQPSAEQSAEQPSLPPEEGQDPAQESAAPESDDEGGKPRSEKRIAQLTARARRAERKAEYLESQLYKGQRQAPAEPEPETPEPEPTPPAVKDFDGDLERFAEAQTQYVKDLRAYDRKQAELAQERQQRQAEQDRRRAEMSEAEQRQVSMLERGMDSHEDYEDVVFDPSLPISNEMLEAASDLENGEEVLYRLGQNPAEAARISKLTGRKVVIEMTKLASAPGETPKPRKGAGTPPPTPPNPARGKGDRPDSGTPEGAKDMDEYARRYYASLKERGIAPHSG